MIVLTRENEITPDGTFGRLTVPLYNGLYDPGSPNIRGSLVTAEDDWRDNQRGRSCIPPAPGSVGPTYYEIRRGWFPKHGECFQVVGVALAGRQAILLHPGNTEEDTEGCILLGLRFSTLPVIDEDDPLYPRRVKRSAADSRAAWRRFMGWMAHTDVAPFRVQWALVTGAGEPPPIV